jgi:membrane protease YdiL (CAAX protease family)
MPQNSNPIQWWHGFVFFAAAMGLQLVLGIVIVIIAQIMAPSGATATETAALIFTPGMVAIQVMTTCSLLTVVALLIPKAFSLAPRRYLRLGATSPEIFAYAALGIVGVGFLGDEAVFVLHRFMPGTFDTTTLTAFNELFVSAPTATFVILTLVVAVGPGIGEELFFRGLVLRSFERNMTRSLAVLLSAFLFGVMHMDLLQGFGAMLLGLFLGFVTIQSGSIWPAVTAHAFNNLLCSLFARYNPPAAPDPWEQGHPAAVLVPSILITVASVYALSRLSQNRREVG